MKSFAFNLALAVALVSSDAFMLMSPTTALTTAPSITSTLPSPLHKYHTSLSSTLPADYSSSSSISSVVPNGGGAPPTRTTGGSITVLVFNLVKNIVGAGVLSLPAGVAAFGDAPSALIPAVSITVLIGLLSAYCFSLIGRVCASRGATSYREAWEKSVGATTSWIPASACTFKTGVASLAYSMILADTFRALLATAGIVMSRTNTLFALTGTVLLPLCMLDDLSKLAPFSLLGIAGMIFTVVAMFIRLVGGSYAPVTGRFIADLAPAVAPSFGTAGWRAAAGGQSTILLCMLSTAYLAHYNAPKFFNELKDNTVPRFNKMIAASFSLAIALCVAVMSIGFLTFGKNSSGLILNNYSNKVSAAHNLFTQ